MIFDKDLFDMANEPDMHYPFLFNYVKGEEWRTQKETIRLIETYFRNAPDGLPGNDDCGTMSAWVAFSMMGLYPVCPGDMNFALTTPVFDRIEIDLDGRFYQENRFKIIKHTGNGDGVIKEIKLNGEVIHSYFIQHNQITEGGQLEIVTK